MAEMDGYDSDELLSQYLDIVEGLSQADGDEIFLTQNTYANVEEDDRANIFDILENAVDVTDMGQPGGPYMVGADRYSNPGSSGRHEQTRIVEKDVKAGPESTSRKKYDLRSSKQAGVDISNGGDLAVVQEPGVDISNGGDLSVGHEPAPKRFKTVNSDTLDTNTKPYIPENTRRKNTWAVNTYGRWCDEMVKDNTCTIPGLLDILKRHDKFETLSDKELNVVLPVFILSLRKEDGKEYPGSTVFQLVCGLQRYLEFKGRIVQFFKDVIFKDIKYAVDNTMQQRTREGVGITKQKVDIVSIDQENYLWEKGFLGSQDGEHLLNAVFWVIGIHFGLRGGEDHRNLSMKNFTVAEDEHGVRYLEYTESVSKANRGGIKHMNVDRKICKAYEHPNNPNKCPVKIFQNYVAKLSPKTDVENAFYFKPLVVVNDGNVWYTSLPLGHNKLRDMVKTIMGKAGFKGNYTNHSLRATTASRLFRANVPEQLIREQTGHRSNAIYAYKRPSSEQKRSVSAVLQGQTSENTKSPSVEMVVNSLIDKIADSDMETLRGEKHAGVSVESNEHPDITSASSDCVFHIHGGTVHISLSKPN